MGPRKTEQWRAVQVFELVGGGHAIVGGRLGDDSAWVPSSTFEVDGDTYLPLSKCDRKLSALVGSTLTCNLFWELMHNKRNSACVEELMKVAAGRDPVGNRNTQMKSLKSAGINKKDLSESAPANVTVALKLPSADDEADPVPVKLAFAIDSKTVPAVLLDAATLGFVAKALSESDGTGRGRKRKSSERITFDVPEVHFNYARHAAYVRYRDPDGRTHTKHMQLDRQMDRDEACAQVSSALHAFYVQNHYGEAVADHEQDVA